MSPERQIEWNIPDGLEAYADEGLLRIAMENLLQNAWKFTRKTPMARIEVGETEDGGQRVHYIRDNGVGFDMAHADKLFKPFQRLHSMSEFEGTGIGLALVMRIVHRHNGKVWAEASPDAGAGFYFVLDGKMADAEPAGQ